MTRRCGCYSHDGFLTKSGYDLVAQREALRPALDDMQLSMYLDKVGSVSGSGSPSLHWDSDMKIDQQYLRFHNGS